MNKKFVLIILILSFSISLNAQKEYSQLLDCFSIVAGKNATEDGSVIIAHNEDTGIRLTNYYKVDEKKHKPGETIILRNGGELPQAEETAGYIWINLPGIDVCDSYLNDYGVSIASDGCPSREDNPELTDGGIVFWLRRIVAQRAKTAREGIKIAGELIEQFGYASSGRTYLVGDANEGWMMSVVHGKHWVARRVPDDMVAVMPNYYTIGEIDLSDTVNYLGSADLIDYAISRDWYNPDRDGEFHFARAYANPGSLTHPGNYKRMWRGVTLLTGEEYEMTGDFPFAVKPEKKISLSSIMFVMRDHYEGTDLDKSLNYSLGNPNKMNGPTICANGTQYSFVAQLRNWLPAEIGSMMWIASRRPDAQAYIPLYSGINKIPELFYYKDADFAIKQHFDPEEDTFDREKEHAFWDFVSLAEWSDEDYLGRTVEIRKYWEAFEEKEFKDQESVEAGITKVFKQDKERGRSLLTDYSGSLALRVHKETINLKSLFK